MKKLLLFLLLIPILVFGQANLKPTNLVNDYCDLLKIDQLNDLNLKLSNFEKQTSIEISIAIVNSLEDRDIESFSTDLFKSWKIGKADRDNGLLVVIAPNERQWRIEIGYGLEPYLTDYESSEIANNNFKPNFINNDYYLGISSFIDQLTNELGIKTWDDRVAYKKQLEEESRHNTIIFFRTLLYIVLGIIALAIVITLSILVKRKIELKKQLETLISEKLDKYKNYITKLNESGYTYGISEILEDSNLVKSFKTSTLDNIEYNYQTLIQSLNMYDLRLDLVINIHTLFKKLEDTRVTFNSKASTHGIEKISSDVIKWDANSKIETLRSLERTLNSKINDITSKLSKVQYFERLISIPNTKFEEIETNITNSYNKFLKLHYHADLEILNEFKIKLKKVLLEYANIDKKFENFDKLDSVVTKFHKINNDLQSYISNIDLSNINYTNKVNKLNKSSERIKQYEHSLRQYLSNSDVSSRTKSNINTFLILLLAYTVGSDVERSFDEFKKLEDTFHDLSDSSELEISNEISRRTREQLRIKQKREEEERERNRNTSDYSGYGYGYGSSYGSGSSYDSGSSFGGFGGGDCGGGGSSGGW